MYDAFQTRSYNLMKGWLCVTRLYTISVCMHLLLLPLPSHPLTCSALWEVWSCHFRLASRPGGWSDGWRQCTVEHHGPARLCRGSASPLGGPVWWSAERREEGEEVREKNGGNFQCQSSMYVYWLCVVTWADWWAFNIVCGAIFCFYSISVSSACI